MGDHAQRRNLLLFAAMALIWGVTWAPLKLAVTAMPPVMFAGVRFIPAGLLLLLFWRGLGNQIGFARRDWPRLLLVSLLIITSGYGLTFWAIQYVPSGLTAVIANTLTPVSLLGFAVVMGEETFDVRRVFAIALGGVGLAFLFWASFSGHDEGTPFKSWGVVALVVSVVAYGFGSILARPLLRSYSSLSVAGATDFLGGLALLAVSLTFESGAAASLDFSRWSLELWLCWAFLVLFGSIVAATIYLVLLKAWNPSRAGSFAFVSPVIAVFLGMAVFGEKVGPTEAAGMILMLAATVLALRNQGAKQIPATGPAEGA